MYFVFRISYFQQLQKPFSSGAARTLQRVINKRERRREEERTFVHYRYVSVCNRGGLKVKPLSLERELVDR